MRKFIKKITLFTLTISVFIGLINVNAGYTYDSKGEPIYSTEGFTVNELPYTYSGIGIESSTLSVPSDLFVYNLEDPNDENSLIPQEMYLTDSGLNAVYVLNTNFQLTQKLTKFRLVPDKLYSTNAAAIKTRSADGKKTTLLFPNEVPTQAELDDPDGAYGGKGYVEVELYKPTSAYRSVTSLYEEVDGHKVKKYLDLIYICDKGNNQIIILDQTTYDETTQTYEVYQVLTKPTDELDSTKEFAPQKVVTDDKGRMYVIADNITQGIMQFSTEGGFQRYTGKNDITLSAWEIFWRNLASESQLESQSANYNTTFNSMVYSEAMIYTTSLSITNQDGTINDKIMIKRINPSGGDTLARNGYKVPMGDVKYSNSTDRDKSEKGPSQLVGITVNGYQVYSVVDKLRGRIFSYDKEGNLLYISGSNNGTQADKLSIPVAIQYFGEDLLVLDQMNKTIVKFEPTEIAKLINEAVKLDNIGRRTRIEPSFNPETNTWWINKTDTGLADKNAQFESKEVDGKLVWFIGGINTNIEVELGSTDYWEKVVALNANYEYGYVGIGHRYLEEEIFEEAMRYFELGKNRVYYSKAYKQYRDGIIKQWFAPVVVTIAVLIAAKYVFKVVKNKKLGIKKEEETGVGDE